MKKIPGSPDVARSVVKIPRCHPPPRHWVVGKRPPHLGNETETPAFSLLVATGPRFQWSKATYVASVFYFQGGGMVREGWQRGWGRGVSPHVKPGPSCEMHSPRPPPLGRFPSRPATPGLAILLGPPRDGPFCKQRFGAVRHSMPQATLWRLSVIPDSVP